MHHWTPKGWRPHHCWLCPCQFMETTKGIKDWDHSWCEPITKEQLETREFFEYIKGVPRPESSFRIATYRGIPILNPKGLGKIYDLKYMT